MKLDKLDPEKVMLVNTIIHNGAIQLLVADPKLSSYDAVQVSFNMFMKGLELVTNSESWERSNGTL